MAWFAQGTSRIYYEDEGAGAPVLLLPGFSESIEGHNSLKKSLVSSGYRVIRADLPGSGRSEPQPRAYPVGYYADDAQSFASLLHNLGVGPAHLMGFSDGGEVALIMAATMPNAARSVATWGACGVANDPGGQLRQAMYHIVDAPIPPLQEYRDFLVATYGEANARAMTQSLADALTQIIETRGGDISLSLVDRIACPVLLIAGEHDMFVSAPLITQLAARIRTAECVEVKDAGHDVHNTHPEWMAQTLLDWLKRH